MRKWIRLKDLRPGAIFKTETGTKAVKSEYMYSNKADSQCQCILLKSGEYGHFIFKNETWVKEIKGFTFI